MLTRLRSLFTRRSRTRPVLVHAHMFKNAGTTFDWSLRRSFGDHFVDHREDDDMKRGAEYFGPWLQQHTHCQAISSHWITQPLPGLDAVDIALCLLFRDPVERMRSVYQFERQQQGVDTPGSIRAKKMSFYEYMSWQMEPMPGPVVKNYHTRYCSGDYLGEDLPAMYERALALLDSTPTLGLVHRYDESMVLFEHQLERQFPGIDLSYLKQNVLSAVEDSHRQRRDAVLEELGDIADTVLAANEYDMRLFTAAEQKFETLLAKVHDLDTRLGDLQARNARLREQQT